MKTKILFILTIALFALGGCKTVKQTETAKQTTTTDVTVNQSSEQHNDIKLKVDSSKLIIDKGNVSELIQEEIVTVLYAPRDSNGQQAVVSVTTTKRGIDRSEAKNLQVNKKNTTNFRNESDFKSEARVFASSENEIKQKATTENKTNFNTALWVVLILLSVVALIVWLVKPVWFSMAYKWVLKAIKLIFNK